MKMTMEKKYAFSITKHAHDIEFYANRIFNTMKDMESGEIQMDGKRYDKLYNMYYGQLMELREAIQGSYSPIAQLTGKQIGLAKKIVLWASETRANTQIEQGKYENLKYC